MSTPATAPSTAIRTPALTPTSRLLVLGGLLVAQLALALLLALRGADLGPAAAQGALLEFTREAVSEILVSGPEGDEVELVRTDGAWRLPALGDFPAAPFKVEGLLDKIAAAERRLPVATTPEALARFRVADDAFERRVRLAANGRELGVLYLGDSPGFRRLFVRAGGEQAVHEAEIGLFDAPSAASDWADHTALHLDEDAIQRIELPDLTLERAGQGWRLADPAPGEALDQAAAARAVRQIANLSVTAVLGAEDPDDYGLDAPALHFRVALASGELIEYQVSRTEPPIVLAVSGRPQRFELADYTGRDLAELTRGSLLAPPADADKPSPDPERDPIDPSDARADRPDIGDSRDLR
ncbi:MAG: DUF4340 domain-containing protein [Chromatiaceae bacterium]|jgi:hypothetical protein|nr:DUF4340 domain-containing protein [Chromatiaceae bacterium]